MPDTGAAIANLTFAAMRRYLHAARRRGIGMMHTARPFSVYRRVFYPGRSADTVLAELHGRRVVDVGCGFTPFMSDSMFQACHRAGIEFYGVDPVLEGNPGFGPREWLLARATGSRAQFNRHAGGLERAVPATAENMPFEAGSVDEILCSYLLFVWIEDQAQLASVFDEFHRVLIKGGSVQLYPMPAWREDGITHPALKRAIGRFNLSQRLVRGGLDPRIIPAMVWRLVKVGA